MEILRWIVIAGLVTALAPSVALAHGTHKCEGLVDEHCFAYCEDTGSIEDCRDPCELWVDGFCTNILDPGCSTCRARVHLP
ncbi:MAG TPA: hypothetical protein VM889_01860 [Candidatus Thermoplasmatota archaeon]|nr:hypothetical protein [Candidatus Thermoplasmatota archaeon]